MDKMEMLHGKMDSMAERMQDLVFAESEPCQADIIFVPGNGYPEMAERAAVLYKEGLSPYILPSGKYSITNGRFGGVLHKKELYNGQYATEWEFLRTVLLNNGVPDEAILREDRATFTYENALFSRDVTEAGGLCIKKALLCCKNYHAGRALMYYQTVFPGTEFFVCPVSVDGITRQTWRSSAEGIREVTAEAQRILTQFYLMM